MRPLNRDLLCVLGCVAALVCPADIVAQAASTSQHSIPPHSILAAEAELPDSPGASQSGAQSQTPTTQQSGSQPTSNNNDHQNEKLQRPAGTAAAEAPKVSGITAAQPAGVAIAPAKQKRARSIVIKVGAIVGGAAALGAVVALTRSTPSKPPGAH